MYLEGCVYKPRDMDYWLPEAGRDEEGLSQSPQKSRALYLYG